MAWKLFFHSVEKSRRGVRESPLKTRTGSVARWGSTYLRAPPVPRGVGSRVRAMESPSGGRAAR